METLTIERQQAWQSANDSMQTGEASFRSTMAKQFLDNALGRTFTVLPSACTVWSRDDVMGHVEMVHVKNHMRTLNLRYR
jgi:hypothetical protein